MVWDIFSTLQTTMLGLCYRVYPVESKVGVAERFIEFGLGKDQHEAKVGLLELNIELVFFWIFGN